MLGLALKSLRQRLGLSLVCIAAVALAVASLGASLGVGDALEKELERLARTRRGQATDVLLFPRPLSREALARVGEMGDQAAAIYDERGRARIPEGPHIESTVLGIDDGFTALHGLSFQAPRGREAFLSQALANTLGVGVGETVLVDLPKTRALSGSLLFGDRSGAQATVRLKVTRILGAAEGGEFTLRPSPDLPRTVFASSDIIAEAVSPEGNTQAQRPPVLNRILLRSSDQSKRDRLIGEVVEGMTLGDFGVRISSTSLGAVVHSTEATISQSLESTVRASLATPAQEALAYLATGIDLGQASIPYSVVMGLSAEELRTRSGNQTPLAPSTEGIWLSEWAARDLAVKPGTVLTLHFDLWREAGRLEPQTTTLTVAGIVPDEKAAGDRALVPTYPGISNAASLGEWDPPFPIDLGRIRPKDEAFWKQYGPSPKAYLDIATARELFGSSGSRLTTLFAEGVSGDAVQKDVLDRLREGAAPFTTQDLASASGASSALDFGAYFAGFSALLIMSALLVAAAFVRFLFETRSQELGVLRMCGWTAADVRRLCLTEASLLSALGALLGLILAPLVSTGLQQILRPVWARGVSGSPALLTAESLVVSMILGFGLSVAALVMGLRATLKREPLALLLSREAVTRPRQSRRWMAALPVSAAILFSLAALFIRTGTIPEGPGFFLLGGCALTFGLGLMRGWVLGCGGGGATSPVRVGLRGLRFRPARVLFVATLLSCATFVVFSVSSFAKRDTSDRTPEGPRGGFDLFVETSGAVFDDLGTKEGRERAGLGEADGPLGKTAIARFRLREGEDTSCLNLYAPRNPRILGAEKAFRTLGRFSFAASLGQTDAERANPWSLLMPKSGLGQEVPAIADVNSLQYVLHKGLGDTMEILDGHGRPLRVRFVAALKESALRSEILIAEEAFETYFPGDEGYRVFLVEAPTDEAEIAQALREAWRDRGALVSGLRDRLARYYEVENTYLASFQWLGVLAAALSTLTLIAVAARSVFERRPEWFVLRTTGFSPRDLKVIVASEIAALSLASIAIGALSAAIALMPLPRASHPAMVLTLLFPAISLLATATATLAAFKVLEDPRASRPAIG